MTSYVTDGTVGPWAKDKLECLDKYLSAYTTIMKEQRWCKGYYYIDAFAGAGIAPLRDYSQSNMDDGQLSIALSEPEGELTQYILGSPHVALQIQNPFSKYFFIDLSASNTASLQALQKEYAEKSEIDIRSGDANQAVRQIVDEVGLNKYKDRRGFVFLDPFGMQVTWDTIELLANTNATEVLINFPLGMAIQRLLPRDGSITEDNRLMLDRYFGSPEWVNHVYEQEPNLFGEVTTSKREDSSTKLVQWYRNRLDSIFGYTATPRLITNTRGGHLYYLLFAGPNKNGAKIANDVLLKQGKRIR